METNNELKSCPFCGNPTIYIAGQNRVSKAQEGDARWVDRPFYSVVCDINEDKYIGSKGCGASGCFKPTKDEAAKAWNTRYITAELHNGAGA